MKLSALHALFGGNCAYCSRRTVITSVQPHPNLAATKDHDIPKCRVRYFAAIRANEVLACFACNNAKDDMTGPEFLSFRQTRRLPQSYIEFLEQRAVKRLRL